MQTEMTRMKPVVARPVVLWPIERLKPHPQNARVHSAEQVEQIGVSIRDSGFTQPILVDETGTVLAGHGKLEAARQLGLKVHMVRRPMIGARPTVNSVDEAMAWIRKHHSTRAKRGV